MRGYENAQQEIKNQAKVAIQASMKYADMNWKGIQSKEPVLEKYLDGSLGLLVAPQFRLKLLGQDYVIRQTLQPKYTYAWMVAKEESEILDNKLREIVLSRKNWTNADLENLQRKKQQELCDCLSHNNHIC